MRTIYGLLAIGLLTLALGIALTVRAIWYGGPTEAAAPAASIKQIMRGIVAPASTTIYNAVSTTVTEAGTQEVYPRNDQDWETVGSSAMALVEAANLLKVDRRAKDRGDWPRMSDAMNKAAMMAYRASAAKSIDSLLAAGEVLNNSCESCHRNYDVPID